MSAPLTDCNQHASYAELAVSSSSGGRNHRRYSVHLATKDGQAEWAWVAWINTGLVDPPKAAYGNAKCCACSRGDTGGTATMAHNLTTLQKF